MSNNSSISIGGKSVGNVVVDGSNKSIAVSGDAIGNVITSGDSNNITLDFAQTTLPDVEQVDIQAELTALRELLASLQGPDQKKVDRAMEDVDDELAKAEPDRDEIGDALERALKYAQKADDWADTAAKLQTHVTGAVSWLGDN